MVFERAAVSLGMLLLIVGVSATVTRAQTTCDDFDQCTSNDMCVVVEMFRLCQGTPIVGCSCDDNDDCTTNDKYSLNAETQEIECIGDNVDSGTPCEGGCGTCQSLSPIPVPGLPLLCQPIAEKIGQGCDSDRFGPCFDTTCETLGVDPFQVAFCSGPPKRCPDENGNPCKPGFCNPETGACETSPGCPTCFTCSPQPGVGCVPAPVGIACEDSNGCTAQSHCDTLQGFVFCVEGPPSVSTTTPTPSVTASATVGTPTATATPTKTTTPTATGSGATVTPGGVCVGDCEPQDRKVSIDELVRGVNIALGTVSLDTCESFDKNDSTKVEINELITGVNNALNSCPP